MREVDEGGRGKEVAIKDYEGHIEEMAKECIEVWDSMEGKLPSFGKFCEMYMNGKMMAWLDKARWN